MHACIKLRRRGEAFAGHADSFLERLLFQHRRRAIGAALQMAGKSLFCCRF